jgi:hypothetical protein
LIADRLAKFNPSFPLEYRLSSILPLPNDNPASFGFITLIGVEMVYSFL